MAAIRRVRRGARTYYYAVQSYRWGGAARQKSRYLGTAKPADPEGLQTAIERAVWGETWFVEFDRFAREYRARRARIPKSVDAKELRAFVIDFTYETNRIEGSTLSRWESFDLLEHGVTPRSRPWSDALETRRHAAVAEQLLQKPRTPTVSALLTWHRHIFGETKPDIAGKLRDFDVRIGGSQHRPPPSSIVRPHLAELESWQGAAGRRLHPVERAAEFHLRFESIHPFGDGNGRVGRLALNSMLLRDGYPPVNILYSKRRGYYHALERSNVTKSSRPFIHWFFAYFSRYRAAVGFG
jgi:Fic family protein